MLLRILVFICGAVLMALEILGARVLAPVLGTSIFVWGALITSFMVAMSIGYWVGGLLSVRHAHLRALGLAAAGAGALTVLVPTLASAVLPSAATLGPRLGPLTAAMGVFFAPTLLLSFVSPMAVRIASLHPDGVGRTAGSLYALSTAGSILGSLGTAFWLIPLAPVDTLVIASGLLLAVIGVLAALAPVVEPQPRRAAWVTAVVLAAAFAAAVGIGTLAGQPAAAQRAANDAGERIVFRKDTQYHRITVTDRQGVRSLKFDNRRQSAIDLKDGYSSDIAYTDYLHLALALKPDAKRVLVLGLGGGALPKRMWHDYPGMQIDSVEIDPVVVDVAKRYFGMPDSPRLRVFTQDARQYVATTRDRYDIVVVDAYYADSIPFHLTTAEFFRQVRRILNPDGVVAYNLIGNVEGGNSKLFRSFYKTVGSVWPDTYVFPVGIAKENNPTMIRNIILLASDGAVPDSILLDRIERRVDGRVSVRGFADFGADLYMQRIPIADVPELTDRFAPVDSLIHIE
jgi:spermidine synthase